MITSIYQFLDSDSSTSYDISVYNKGVEASIGLSGGIISRVHPIGPLSSMDFINVNNAMETLSSTDSNMADILSFIPKNMIDEITIVYESICNSDSLIIGSHTMLNDISAIPSGYDLVISREDGNTRNITLDAIHALSPSILEVFLTEAILDIKNSFALKGKINHNEFMILLSKFVRNINVFFLNSNSIEVR